MHEITKYSMIADSIHSTHKVQGHKVKRMVEMGGDWYKIA